MIIWNGQAFFGDFFACPGLTVRGDDKALAFRNLYKGSGAFLGLDRWRFWKDGFAVAVSCGEYGEECKLLASKAQNLMGAIEHSMLF